jgi:hypothetical protein
MCKNDNFLILDHGVEALSMWMQYFLPRLHFCCVINVFIKAGLNRLVRKEVQLSSMACHQCVETVFLEIATLPILAKLSFVGKKKIFACEHQLF